MRSEAGDRLCELPYRQCKRLLAEGKVDAYLAFPPDTQELRARKVGHVVANSTVDRPWSRYFCCLATGHREFVRKHPNATKRALRAILKAADIWGLEPERAARALVDGGFTPRYDYALETVKNVPYTSGASTIRKTPFASMPFASARRE
jgi:NitT/TauT family transport system substrate-binding protein